MEYVPTAEQIEVFTKALESGKIAIRTEDKKLKERLVESGMIDKEARLEFYKGPFDKIKFGLYRNDTELGAHYYKNGKYIKLNYKLGDKDPIVYLELVSPLVSKSKGKVSFDNE